MINCNPETVSTDYDTSDRLYFEPLTAEDVLAILDKEREAGTLKGVIVQFGGQTPLKLAHAIELAGAPILGTSVDSIDLAEDRDRFKRLLDKLGFKQPKNGIAYSVEQARLVAAELGLPLVVRPSYVLGGRAMAIIHDEGEFDDYLLGVLPSLVPADVKARYPNDKTGQINTVLGKNPLLFDRYLSDAIEIDVDALSDGKDVIVAGIMEHIEEAGIHSGDSACSLPPRSLSAETIAKLEEETRRLALALEVGGLMNVQYALKDGEIYVLEVNPRASRTVPFVAKVIGQPIAKIASRVMAGEPLAKFALATGALGHVGVKEAVFPFARFPGVDTVLGPEMRSTGEVMGIDRNFAVAFAKSQLGAGSNLPRSGTVFVSLRDADKPGVIAPLKLLTGLGFKVIATGGTQRYLEQHGVPAEKINKVSEGRPARRRRGAQRPACSSCSTPPRGRPRSPIPSRCAAPPSCKERPITPHFPERSRRPKASRPISPAISKSERCRTISRDPARGGPPIAEQWIWQFRDRVSDGEVSDHGRGPRRPGGGVPASPTSRAAAHRPGDRRGALARRSVGKRRIPFRQRGAVAQRGPHRRARGHAPARRSDRRVETVGVDDQVRRDGDVDRRGHRGQEGVSDRRRERGGREIRQGLDHLADGARADRQEGRR